LARIVTDDRGELPAEGLAPSLLSDLVQLTGCDFLVFGGTDSGQQVDWFGQTVPAEADDPTFDVHAFGRTTGTARAATPSAPATCEAW
jgi:hypothetical protein